MSYHFLVGCQTQNLISHTSLACAYQDTIYIQKATVDIYIVPKPYFTKSYYKNGFR